MITLSKLPFLLPDVTVARAVEADAVSGTVVHALRLRVVHHAVGRHPEQLSTASQKS